MRDRFRNPGDRLGTELDGEHFPKERGALWRDAILEHDHNRARCVRTDRFGQRGAAWADRRSTGRGKKILTESDSPSGGRTESNHLSPMIVGVQAGMLSQPALTCK